MVYTLGDKTIKIPDIEIEKNMKLLELTKEEAIEMWLEDNEYLENKEQEELNTKANKVKINHGAGAATRKKSDKPRTVKISDEKKELFSVVFDNLQAVFGENVQILKENKLISVKINEKTFKLDVIEQRQPKK